MAEAHVLAAENDAQAFIQVQGRATFKVAPLLRQYGLELLDRGVCRIVLDLAECDGMDSTFMGVIAMVGLGARKANTQVVLVNTGSHNRKLLDDLGVSRVLMFARSDAPAGGAEDLREVQTDDSADGELSGEVVLEAHEVLMDLDAENVPKFRDVVELLHREIDERKQENETGDINS